MILIRFGKSCGCLIGAGVAHFEIEKRKKIVELEKVRKKLRTASNKKLILRLKGAEKSLLNSVKESHEHKKAMKKRFEKYVKESGYVPPKFKHKR